MRKIARRQSLNREILALSHATSRAAVAAEERGCETCIAPLFTKLPRSHTRKVRSNSLRTSSFSSVVSASPPSSTHLAAREIRSRSERRVSDSPRHPTAQGTPGHRRSDYSGRTISNLVPGTCKSPNFEDSSVSYAREFELCWISICIGEYGVACRGQVDVSCIVVVLRCVPRCLIGRAETRVASFGLI